MQVLGYWPADNLVMRSRRRCLSWIQGTFFVLIVPGYGKLPHPDTGNYFHQILYVQVWVGVQKPEIAWSAHDAVAPCVHSAFRKMIYHRPDWPVEGVETELFRPA